MCNNDVEEKVNTNILILKCDQFGIMRGIVVVAIIP